MAGAGAHDLDGRAPASSGLCSTHLAGFFDRQVGGADADRHTTHLKESDVRRNGVPRSERATVAEHWIRHGDYLTMVTIVRDPAYLTEPFIRSSDYFNDNTHEIPAYPCEYVTEIDRPSGVIPHHLPGQNKFLAEFADKYKLPLAAVRGGAETMYPEYRVKVSGMPRGGAVATK